MEEMRRETQFNYDLAGRFWMGLGGVVGLCTFVRFVIWNQHQSRLDRSKKRNLQFPTRPTGRFSKAQATITAILREIRYPQLYVPFRYLTWLTPPPLGRIYVLMVYWAVIIYMMTYHSIRKDLMYYERIGYRNAWVTATQMPFLYMLSNRTNIVGFFAGVSYERLNWLHRWVARTMFVTATVHGFHFITHYAERGMLKAVLASMKIPKRGLVAWGLLLWMVLTGLKPIRSVAYEVFVIQHIAVACLFIWAVHLHVPDTANWAVWFSVAAIVWERAWRLMILLFYNIKIIPRNSQCAGEQWIGHRTQLTAIGESLTILTIKDVHMYPKAGQHVYLWLPWLGPFEMHPYTIASSVPLAHTCICNSIQLAIRTHSGFSKRVNNYARKLAESEQADRTLTAFVLGPYGQGPQWKIYETMVLIAASTGASFTLPILDAIAQQARARQPLCTKRVDFLMTSREDEDIRFYRDKLVLAGMSARAVGIELTTRFILTGPDKRALTCKGCNPPRCPRHDPPHETSEDAEKENKAATEVIGRGSGCCSGPEEIIPVSQGFLTRNPPTQESSSITDQTAVTTEKTATPIGDTEPPPSRADIAEFIRTAVEATGGETGVVVCGGPELIASVRNAVAKLSDERAVHKGTGAQGIHLHAEEYCF